MFLFIIGQTDHTNCVYACYTIIQVEWVTSEPSTCPAPRQPLLHSGFIRAAPDTNHPSRTARTPSHPHFILAGTGFNPVRALAGHTRLSIRLQGEDKIDNVPAGACPMNICHTYYLAYYHTSREKDVTTTFSLEKPRCFACFPIHWALSPPLPAPRPMLQAFLDAGERWTVLLAAC